MKSPTKKKQLTKSLDAVLATVEADIAVAVAGIVAHRRPEKSARRRSRKLAADTAHAA